MSHHENEDLGELREIMVDIESGEIAYAVLSFGGLFGVGDKLFAVPWQALHLDAINRRITFAFSRRKLQKIPGFDKNRWPDRANPQFLDIRSDTPFEG